MYRFYLHSGDEIATFLLGVSNTTHKAFILFVQFSNLCVKLMSYYDHISVYTWITGGSYEGTSFVCRSSYTRIQVVVSTFHLLKFWYVTVGHILLLAVMVVAVVCAEFC
jgi:hypothetical protein